ELRGAAWQRVLPVVALRRLLLRVRPAGVVVLHGARQVGTHRAVVDLPVVLLAVPVLALRLTVHEGSSTSRFPPSTVMNVLAGPGWETSTAATNPVPDGANV